MKSRVASIELPLPSEHNKNNLRKETLNYLFRWHSFEDLYERDYIFEEKDSYLLLNYLEDKFPNLTLEKVHNIAIKSLEQIYYFIVFLKTSFTFPWHPRLEDLYRKSRILLHQFYRIAPVFDYQRARSNLKSLQGILNHINFWPQICTQIALIIFITDNRRNIREHQKSLLQKNIRTFCNCSAYAFHRARRIIYHKSKIKM